MKLIELKDVLVSAVELFWDNEPKENIITKKFFGYELAKMYGKYGKYEIDYISGSAPFAGSYYTLIKIKGVKS